MTNPIIISINSYQLSSIEKNNLKNIKPFGVILFTKNINNFKQLQRLISSIKLVSQQTLIFIDQEGGIVNRFKSFPEFQFKDNYDLYKIYLTYPSVAKHLVFLKSFITSYYLSKLGVNVNTIPVLDIPLKNTVSMIKKRTFGHDLKINTLLTDILVQTSLNFGILPVMKHFPGHGLTSKDSHLIKPVSLASKKVLKHHLSLFERFINLPMIMTAHIKYSNFDKSNIATYSPFILKNLLRSKLNYQGLIMSDDLEMKANEYDLEKSIFFSNISGLDIILDCSTNWERYNFIVNNFKKTKYFKKRKQILPSKNITTNHYQSININHYHELYNEIIKLYGI